MTGTSDRIPTTLHSAILVPRFCQDFSKGPTKQLRLIRKKYDKLSFRYAKNSHPTMAQMRTNNVRNYRCSPPPSAAADFTVLTVLYPHTHPAPTMMQSRKIFTIPTPHPSRTTILTTTKHFHQMGVQIPLSITVVRNGPGLITQAKSFPVDK